MTAKEALTAAHETLALYAQTGPSRHAGLTITRLLDAIDAAGYRLSEDTEARLFEAQQACLDLVEQELTEALEVLVDDRLPDHTVTIEASENGDADWGYPVYAVITTPEGEDLEAYGLCDLLAADPEQQADFLWEQLQEGL